MEEFQDFPQSVQDEIAELLSAIGPTLKRPHADTLKELRFDADDGVWRLAYAFDPERRAILLVAGDTSGTSSARFYKTVITKADIRFAEHLDAMKKGTKK